jgi:hypothetical protein
LEWFLGSLNYIRKFYENQAKDVKCLQRRLKKEVPWNENMTKSVQIIKQKIQNLPKLHLPYMDYPFILETDASYEVWENILLKTHSNREQCMYVFGCFKDPKLKYPSSHKEILTVKNRIKRFKLFLKPVHFIVRMDLKHMKGMLSIHMLLEQGNKRVLRWSLWLDRYDFNIEYKPGKDNCIADLLTREAHLNSVPIREIKMITRLRGSSSQPPHPTPEEFH